MTAYYRPELGCHSRASLAGLVLCFIVCFNACYILLVIVPLTTGCKRQNTDKSFKRLKVKLYSSSCTHLRATGRRLPHGISESQCYLPPDTSERAPPTPTRKAVTRITYPGRDGRLSWPSCGWLLVTYQDGVPRWCVCCYQIFYLLKLFHFTTDGRQNSHTHWW